MQQGIAPSILIVGGKPAPCLCRTEGTTKIICAYCVQANLILWEREEARGCKRKGRAGVLLNTFQKLDKGPLAAMLGVSTPAIYKWLRLKNIPEKYAQKFYRGYPQGYLGMGQKKQYKKQGLNT